MAQPPQTTNRRGTGWPASLGAGCLCVFGAWGAAGVGGRAAAGGGPMVVDGGPMAIGRGPTVAVGGPMVTGGGPMVAVRGPMVTARGPTAAVGGRVCAVADHESPPPAQLPAPLVALAHHAKKMFVRVVTSPNHALNAMRTCGSLVAQLCTRPVLYRATERARPARSSTSCAIARGPYLFAYAGEGLAALPPAPPSR